MSADKLGMNSSFKPIEKIVPRLLSGDLVSSETEVKFIRKNDQRETVFPKESRFYLEEFLRGKSVQDVILECYKKSIQIDFNVLKETLLILYWSRNLVNGNEFRDGIEFSDWLPVNESHLIKPLIEIDLKQSFFIAQIYVATIPIALLFAAFKVFTAENPSPLALLLIPSFFLSLKGILSGVVSAIFNKTPQLLSLQISLFGIYLRESSGKRSKTGTFEYLLHFSITVFLGTICFFYFQKTEDLILYQFGPLLSLSTTALLMSPAHKTDLSNFFRLSRKFNFLYLLSVFVFLIISILFFYFSFIEIRLISKNWSMILFFPLLTLIVISVGYFLDLLDDIDFLFDQVINRLFGEIKFSKIDASNIIANIPIFKSLPEGILKEMVQSAKIHYLAAGITIFKEGQHSKELYYLIKGRIGIYKNKPDKSKFLALQMNANSIFGEGGFFLDSPRSADAVTLEHSKILQLKRPGEIKNTNPVSSSLGEVFQKKIWAFQSLSRSEIFRNLPSEVLMQIVNGGAVYELPKDQVIMKQGDLSDSLWIIIQGNCRVFIDEVEKRNLGSGDVIGEIGVIWNTRRTSSVVTTVTSILLRVEAVHIYKILSSNLELAIGLQNLGSTRLGDQS